MLSAIARRLAKIKQSVGAAKKAAPEMIKIYGESVWQEIESRESKAWREGKIAEHLYWRLVREYVREITKSDPTA